MPIRFDSIGTKEHPQPLKTITFKTFLYPVNGNRQDPLQLPIA